MDSTGSPKKLAGRYEVRQILGQGGMGLVYRAYDTVVRREVAVKTILDIPDPASLQLFYKECDVLASMSHPNIVEIFDIGEFEEDGKKKPYFVMPLLPGTTLDHFVRKCQPSSYGRAYRRDHFPDLPRPAGSPRARTGASRSEAEQHLRDGRRLGQDHRLRRGPHGRRAHHASAKGNAALHVSRADPVEAVCPPQSDIFSLERGLL